MQTAERERLMRAMADEPAHAVAVMVKCSVCLALLGLVAVIGLDAGQEGGEVQAARPAFSASLAAADSVRAEAARKEVFDQRRARWLGQTSVFAAKETARAVSPASGAEVTDASQQPDGVIP